MIYYVQVTLNRIIKIDNKIMNIISKISKIFSLRLNVNRTQIQKSLITAPLYLLFIYYLITILGMLIGTQFALETLDMLFMLLPFVAGAIVFYFFFCYIFIYLMQLFLLKYFYINFWSILFCASLHTIILISLGYIILKLGLDDSWTLCLFSIPTAISYWILLFRECGKASIQPSQKFMD